MKAFIKNIQKLYAEKRIQNDGFVNFQQHHSVFSSFSADVHPGLVQNLPGFLCSVSAANGFLDMGRSGIPSAWIFRWALNFSLIWESCA